MGVSGISAWGIAYSIYQSSYGLCSAFKSDHSMVWGLQVDGVWVSLLVATRWAASLLFARACGCRRQTLTSAQDEVRVKSSQSRCVVVATLWHNQHRILPRYKSLRPMNYPRQVILIPSRNPRYNLRPDLRLCGAHLS